MMTRLTCHLEQEVELYFEVYAVVSDGIKFIKQSCPHWPLGPSPEGPRGEETRKHS